MKSPAKPEPAIIVIFGITGDLVKRKLFPALYELIKADMLDEHTVIVGVTRQNISTEEMLNQLIDDYPEYDKSALELLKPRFIVQTMNVTDSTDYKRLLKDLNDIEDKYGMCMHRLYYLSIPPQVFGTIVKYLGENGLNASCQHSVAETRLLVEKPFGYDLASARDLVSETGKYFSEEQIFRIDHYLAKETVQNILKFRFNNAIFESLWSHPHIARVEITAIEKIGIEGRGVFYEQTGALRDLIQSHLIQLMAIIAMEEPLSLSSSDIHKAKLETLNSVSKIQPDKVDSDSLRAQYQTYSEEVNNPKSNVETYAAIQLYIDNGRWKNVPFVIKTGKALDEKKTIVKIIFKRFDSDEKETQHNSLSFRIQPNEGIDIEIIVKKPGLDSELQRVDMDFSYDKYFASSAQPDAYERVLVDAIKGDHTLFATSDEVIASWKIIESIINKWSRESGDLQIYKNNSSGPTNLPEWLKSGYRL